MNEIKNTDAIVRERVLDPAQSFIVSAPAGSGKTELLIQRFLKVLALCEKPEQVLMITFTRKAAAEVRDRIYSALVKAQENKEVKSTHERTTRELALAVLSRDSNQQWQLMLSPSRLQIKTIDSFCFYLAQQTSLIKGEGVFNAVVDNVMPLYREAVINLLESLNQQQSQKEPSTLQLLVEQLFQTYDNNLNTIIDMLCNMLQNRSSWLPLIVSGELSAETVQQNFIEYSYQQIEHWREQLGACIDELSDLVGHARVQLLTEGKNVEIAQQLPESLINVDVSISEWQAVINTLLLTKDGDWRKSISKNNGFLPKTAEKEALLKLLETFGEMENLHQLTKNILTLPALNEGDLVEWPHLQTLVMLLPHLVAHLSVLFQERGQCDHSAVSQAAINAVDAIDEPTELALRLDYQIQHILVDEFQDTSEQQEQLLELLTEGWQYDDGRSLFIVGDAMQSIYSFRQAEVGLFIKARTMGIGTIELQAEQIGTNFRSDAGIVNWVNQTFSRVFPEHDDISQNQTSYHYSEANREANEKLEAVNYNLFESALDEADWITESIKQIQQKEPTAEIAILVRYRTDLKAILPAINQKEIAWNGNDLQPISNRMAVVDIVSLTKALLSWNDRISWLSLLRSPLVGLTSNDLLLCCKTIDETQDPIIWLDIQNPQTLASLSQQGQAILQRVIPIIQNAIEHKKLIPLRELIEDCWRALGAEQILSSAVELNDCMTFFTVLENYCHNQSIDWAEFETQLEKTYSQPLALSSTSEPISDATKRVEIMTIHKAKGLEFDYVFLPSLQRTGGKDNQPLIRWRKRIDENGERQLLLAPKPATAETDAFYNCLQADSKQQSKQEMQRLFYVACTRASRQLYLSTTLKRNTKDAYSVKEQSLLSIIWPQYSEQFITNNTEDTSASIEQQITPTQGIWRQPLDSTLNYQQRWHNYEDSCEQISESVATVKFDLNIEIGNLLHRSLKQITIEGIDQWDTTRINKQLKQWQATLLQQGFSEEQTNTAIEKINRGIETSINDETGRWILNNQHQHSHVEYSIDYLDESGELHTGIIDRCFVDGDTCWIVDYKSSEPAEGQPLDEFKQQQITQYSKQLNKYEQLLKAIMPAKNYHKMLYFPTIGQSTQIH